MKIETIITINNLLTNLQNLNKPFNYRLGKILLTDLMVTNKLISTQNVKLNSLITKYADLNSDNEFLIVDKEKIDQYNEEVNALYNDEVDIKSVGFVPLTEDLIDQENTFDLVTIDILEKLSNYCK